MVKEHRQKGFSYSIDWATLWGLYRILHLSLVAIFDQYQYLANSATLLVASLNGIIRASENYRKDLCC